MSDDAPILGVAPMALPEEPPAEAEPVLEPEEYSAPAKLGRPGKKVLEQVLRVEGELVRNLRGVPADEPQAWRWTDEEVAALMPALEGLAERYGVAATINEHAPTAGAGLAVAMHFNRSLAAERAWRAAHPEHEENDVVRPHDEPAALPDGGPEPGGEPPASEPGAGAGPVDLGAVAALRGDQGLHGGPR